MIPAMANRASSYDHHSHAAVICIFRFRSVDRSPNHQTSKQKHNRPGGIRTPNPRFRNSFGAVDAQSDQQFSSANSQQVQGNPQHPRNKDKQLASEPKPGPDNGGEE